MLRPPPRARDPRAPQTAYELLDRGLLDEGGHQDLDLLDSRPHDEPAKVLLDRLDLGELGHRLGVTRWRL